MDPTLGTPSVHEQAQRQEYGSRNHYITPVRSCPSTMSRSEERTKQDSELGLSYAVVSRFESAVDTIHDPALNLCPHQEPFEPVVSRSRFLIVTAINLPIPCDFHEKDAYEKAERASTHLSDKVGASKTDRHPIGPLKQRRRTDGLDIKDP